MNIGILGLGLMGGSLAKGIKRNIKDHVIYGYDIDKETMFRAKLLEIIDEDLTNENISKLDIIFVCLGLEESKKVIDEIVPFMSDGSICVDFTGVKQSIVNFLKVKSAKFPNIEFISIHPMAGREFSGLKHSSVNLYEKSSILIIPINNSIYSLNKIKSFFVDLKVTNVKITNPIEHDEMIAYTSQLPHILSNAYVKNSLSQYSLGFSAGSFRDFTRVAKISADMWTTLMLENRKNLIYAIEDFKTNLNAIEEALIENNNEKLYKLLNEGNEARKIVDSQKWAE